MNVAARRAPARAVATLPAAAYVLVALILVMAVLEPRFLNIENIGNIARNAAILALAAFGQAIVIITGGIDLSSGSLVALSSVCMVLVTLHSGVPVAFGAGLLVALAIGAANGALVARFGLPPFLATLGMLTVVHGLASLLVGGLPVSAGGGAFAVLGTGWVGPIPIPILVAAGGFVVLELLLRRTVLGRSWYLLGSSRPAALAAGIRVRWTQWSAYLVGAAFVGMAGLVLASRVNSGQPNLEPTIAFEAIAACAIGGLPLTGGIGSGGQVILGVLVLAVVQNGLLLLDLPSSVQVSATGLLTVLAVAAQPATLQRIRTAGRNRR
jgi:ribose/xylose/arabinose/galactoside ABC-type transport system permease subunit